RGRPTAEGLAADDGTGDGAVDVEVAGFDAVHPARDIALVQRLDPAGEAERLRVGELDRPLEILSAHESQHGSEALGAVKEGAGTHTELDTGRPELRLSRRRARLEHPLLAVGGGRQRAPGRGAGRLGQRVYRTV